MKNKQIFLVLLLIVSITAGVSAADISYSATFDNYSDPFCLGFGFGLTQKFENDSGFTLALDYHNAGTYSADLLYDYYIGYFGLNGGLSYSIIKAGIEPRLTAGAAFVTGDFSLSGKARVGMNAENIFNPNFQEYTVDTFIGTTNLDMNISGLYHNESNSAYDLNKSGGGITFSAHDEGAPLMLQFITNINYVMDSRKDANGIVVQAGGGFTIRVKNNDFYLNCIADALTPDRNKAFSISIGKKIYHSSAL